MESRDYFDAIARETEKRVVIDEQRRQEEDIEQQKRAGRCNLIPFPKIATQPFRSDLTVEKNPLFVVNSFKGDWWQYERELKHPDSKEPVTQKVMVGKLDGEGRTWGVLKQVHQQVFYKLLKLWGDRGYPIMERKEGRTKITVGYITTTVYELVKYLRNSDAKKDYSRVREILQELAAIPVVCEHDYSWQKIKDRLQFTLLCSVTWNEAKIDPKTHRPIANGLSEIMILFSPTVTEGFFTKSVKQLLLGPYEEIGKGGKGRRAEIARLLYPLLDHELSSKESYHISLKSLSQRLGITSYCYKSERKRPFLHSVKLLQDKYILGEKYRLHVEIVATSDGEDYVLIARRVACQLKFDGI